MLQAFQFEELPKHGDPPYLGAGLLHDLYRFCIPPPHALLHPPKFPQLPQFPFTERANTYHYKNATIISKEKKQAVD